MQKMRWEPPLEAGLMTWYRPRDNVDDGRVVAKFRLRAAMRDGLANVHAELEPRDAVGPMAGDSCGTTTLLTTPSCSADAAASSAKLHIQHWSVITSFSIFFR